MKKERTQLMRCVNRLINTRDDEFREVYYDTELLDTFEDMVSWLEARRETKSKYDDDSTDSGDEMSES